MDSSKILVKGVVSVTGWPLKKEYRLKFWCPDPRTGVFFSKPNALLPILHRGGFNIAWLNNVKQAHATRGGHPIVIGACLVHACEINDNRHELSMQEVRTIRFADG